MSSFVVDPEALKYDTGFNNEFATEAIPGTLPARGNNPQKCPHDLFAEQISGTAFTMPRKENKRTWFYRIQPSVLHAPFSPVTDDYNSSSGPSFTPDNGFDVNPNQLRWNPLPLPDDSADIEFPNSFQTMAGTGSPTSKEGLAIHMYAFNKSMTTSCMYNSDGDYLIVPQLGALHIQTEHGHLFVPPRFICIIPRGVVFKVCLHGATQGRGYILETFKGHFELPDLGPIGSNGLANPRDFEYPVAAYDDDSETPWVLYNKFGGKTFVTTRTGTPFNVVGWHGNYAPCRYDLEKFCCMNSVTFDHPDPSIYTVLTCPSDTPGTATADFVIFPPRWMVMEDTFRPPWYHRNCMSELMGMIYGKYDAKVGFQPGGVSLHSCMTPHGPDAPTFAKASEVDLKPEKFEAGLAFMFETNVMLSVSKKMLDANHRDKDYFKCWEGIPRSFKGKK